MFSDCLHRIFTGFCVEHRIFPWVMPLSNPDHPGFKKMIFTSLGEILIAFP